MLIVWMHGTCTTSFIKRAVILKMKSYPRGPQAEVRQNQRPLEVAASRTETSSWVAKSRIASLPVRVVGVVGLLLCTPDGEMSAFHAWLMHGTSYVE